MQDHHRFIDEAGDMTFYSGRRSNRTPAMGSNGVSRCFMIGFVHVKQDLNETRRTIEAFSADINSDPFFSHFPSVQTRIDKGWKGYYPHASKDPAELRYEFLKLMNSLEFSAQIVVGRKIPAIYEKKHELQERNFYADLMSHLLKYTGQTDPLILDVVERGSSTSNMNLQRAVDFAKSRRKNNSSKPLTNTFKFNVQPYDHEPLLALADYSLWTVQRAYEKQDIKFYELICPKISLIMDVYDHKRYDKSKNYYTPKYNPLTIEAIDISD